MKHTKPHRMFHWLAEIAWACIGFALLSVIAWRFIITLLESAP